MSIHETMGRTNKYYTKCRVAQARDVRVSEDHDIDYVGSILSEDGRPVRPVGCVVVETAQPTSAIVVVDSSPASAQVHIDALEEMASIISYAGGRAGMLWVNAGDPRMLTNSALLNATRRYRTNGQRAEDTGTDQVESTWIQWEQCVPVSVVKHPRDGVMIDWLKACRPEDEQPGEIESPPAAPPALPEPEPAAPPIAPPPPSRPPGSPPAPPPPSRAPQSALSSPPPAPSTPPPPRR